MRKAVHRFKFQGRQSYALPFARLTAYAVGKTPTGQISLITFVPTNRSNLRKRGYNHAGLMACEMGALLGIPVADTLRKTRRTAPMFGLKPAERRANVLGAFSLCVAKEEILGKQILLVDDVLTTGATLSECARTLKEAGAAKVIGATFTRAREPSPTAKDPEADRE